MPRKTHKHYFVQTTWLKLLTICNRLIWNLTSDIVWHQKPQNRSRKTGGHFQAIFQYFLLEKAPLLPPYLCTACVSLVCHSNQECKMINIQGQGQELVGQATGHSNYDYSRNSDDPRSPPATRPSFLICTRGDSSDTLAPLGHPLSVGFLCFMAGALQVIFPQLIGIKPQGHRRSSHPVQWHGDESIPEDTGTDASMRLSTKISKLL